MITVKFEDLRSDPDTWVGALAKFLDIPADPTVLQDAVDNCSLAVSRQMEESAIAHEIPSRFFESPYRAAYDRGWRYHGTAGVGCAMGIRGAVGHNAGNAENDPSRPSLDRDRGQLRRGTCEPRDVADSRPS